MQICIFICQFAICHVSDTVPIAVRPDVIALDHMADVIAICMMSVSRADVKPNVNMYNKADGIALVDCVGRCYCHVAMYIATDM